MQINSVSCANFGTFKANKPKEKPNTSNLGELIKEMKGKEDAILKISGTYPDYSASLIKKAQYDREKNTRAILKEAKIVEHDLFCTETRSLTILRFIKNGFSNWNHKKAYEMLINSKDNHCQINGKFYTLTLPKNRQDSFIVTRLYDGASVMFNSQGVVEEVKRDDYLMRTEAYYYDEGEGKPFLTCDGYSEKDGIVKAQRAYYTGTHNTYFRNLVIENGKKKFSEYFDFYKTEKNLVLKTYKSNFFRLDLDKENNAYNYKDSSGVQYRIAVN